jgi:nucleoside-diphosphate-sugar epimerase
MKKKYLISGGSGFIGSNLAKKIVDLGNEVHIIIIPSCNIDLLKGYEENIIFHEYDGTYHSLDNAIKNSKPDVVFHLASVFISQHKPNDVENLISSNILFGTQLVEAMVQNEVYRLINTGTSWQHYHDAAYSPVNLYAATKQSMEDIIKYYYEADKLSALHLKLFDTYGPNDPRPKLMNLLKKAIISGEVLEMSGGDQLIDLVYIDDVVDAFYIASESIFNAKNTNLSYGISSNSPIKLKKIIEIISNVIGRRIPIKWGGKPYKTREVMVPWNTFPRLEGWTPKIGLEDGVKNCFQEII